MIHGDIKPHNVLVDVDPSDGTLTPKLTDFGFSCYGCSEETIVYPPQTPGWCAPEWHPRGFTIKKAKKLDIFSYGLLCAWIFLQGKVDTADIIAMSKNELVDRIAGVHRNEIAKDLVLQQICNRLDWFFAQSLVLNVEERGGHMRDLLIGFINPLLEYHGYDV
jgi:serine/threonine protein kinase